MMRRPVMRHARLVWHSKSTSTPANSPKDQPSFVDWLFTSARTEQGKFPDWPYLRDYARALERGDDLIVLKRRQILISWVTAAWFHFVASRNAYHHGAVVSAEGRAAKKQGRRIVTIARFDGYDVSGVELIKYPNGSEITILPSTEHAGVGESLKVAHFDEFDFHPYARQNLGTITPAVSNSGGQTIITSTSNPELGPSGPFHELWFGEAYTNRLFYGKDVRPDQDETFFAAEATKPGMSAAVMRAYYPENPDEAFVAHQGLVFGLGADEVLIFDKRRNVKAAECEWQGYKWRIAALDFGGRDPSVAIPIGVSSDQRLHVCSSQFYYRRAATVDEYATYLFQLHNVAPFDLIVGDPSSANMIASLAALGLPVVAANNDVADRIQVMTWMFRNSLLTVDDERCGNLVTELGSFWYAERKDMQSGGKALEFRTPGHHHADAITCVGYAALAVRDGLLAGNRRKVKVGHR